MVSSTCLTAEISSIVSAYSSLISAAVWLDCSVLIWLSTLLVIPLLTESSTSLTPEIFLIGVAYFGLGSTVV